MSTENQTHERHYYICKYVFHIVIGPMKVLLLLYYIKLCVQTS